MEHANGKYVLAVGTPSELLRRPGFAAYGPVKVMPTYPVWATDTVEGIVTVTLSCILAAVLLLLAIILLAKYMGWCCFSSMRK